MDLEFIRKNMRPSNKSSEQCHTNEDIGVDLNRNYDFAFAHDEVGSNSHPCADDYRGKYPFSEPATRQIKNFIEKTNEGKSIRIALNLHAWGNLLVHPWSFLSQPYRAVSYKPDHNLELLGKFMCQHRKDHQSLFFMKENGKC